VTRGPAAPAGELATARRRADKPKEGGVGGAATSIAALLTEAKKTADEAPSDNLRGLGSRGESESRSSPAPAVAASHAAGQSDSSGAPLSLRIELVSQDSSAGLPQGALVRAAAPLQVRITAPAAGYLAVVGVGNGGAWSYLPREGAAVRVAGGTTALPLPLDLGQRGALVLTAVFAAEPFAVAEVLAALRAGGGGLPERLRGAALRESVRAVVVP
jgi:hypothetical protein